VRLDYRVVCTLHAGSALGGGLAVVAVPGLLLPWFGITADPSAQLVARILGGVLVALGATLWAARDAADRSARRTVIAGNLVCDATVAALIGVAAWKGAVGPLSWSLATLFAANAATWVLVRPTR
jgi:hypothetical protein